MTVSFIECDDFCEHHFYFGDNHAYNGFFIRIFNDYMKMSRHLYDESWKNIKVLDFKIKLSLKRKK